MTTELTTIISQLNVAGGTWRKRAPNQVAVREPKSRTAQQGIAKGDLFVLVELQGAGDKRDSLEKRVAEVIRDAYYTSSGSITASLRRAVQKAATWLYRYNATAAEDAVPLVGGVAVAAVRDSDVFLAQVGPAAIYVTMEDEVLRFPARSAWLDMALDAAQTDETALGLFHFVDPQLAHIKLSEGDLLALADGRLAGQLPLNDVAQALLRQRVEVAARNLGHIAQASDCSALVIEIIEEGSKASALAANGKTASPPPQSGLRPEAAVREGEATHRFQNVIPAANIRSVARRAARQTQKTALSLGAGLLVMGRRLLPHGEDRLVDAAYPARQAGTQAQPQRGRRFSPKTLLYLAVGIPLLALLITGVMYLREGRAQTARFQTSLALAQAKVQEAQTADPASARVLLNEAEGALAEAQTVLPESPEIVALQQSLDEQRDEINQVQRLYYLPRLRQYTDPGTDLSEVIVQGVDLYVLDRGAGRVYHHKLDEAGEALLPDDEQTLLAAPNQQIDDINITDIVDIIWMPAGGGRQTSDLLILERNGLLEYNASWGIASTAIAAVDTWQSPRAVSSYFGNFYVMDTQAQSIKRYLPTVDGYSAPPEEYFLPGVEVDLTGAVDMAIDGDVYVLYGSGQIRKFRAGEPVEFALSGLDAPLSNPTAIYTAPDELAQYIYVADAGNQRIVQFSKQGVFLRQFKPRAGEATVFDKLQAIFVDEIGGKMYILNGNDLYGANVPVE